MISILKIVGLILLLTIALFPIIGNSIFGKTITYGQGLGDLFMVIASLVCFIIYITLTHLKVIKSSLKPIVILLMYLSILYFAYSFTLGRGTETPWDGHIFH